LAFAYPVSDEDQIKDLVSKLRKEHYSARHHCYAYRIGLNGEQWRINDDGEPSSTAGKPIYGQILSNELSDILIVVVRYFGGVKLGVPGLIKAYKTAAADAIANAGICEKRAMTTLNITFPFEQLSAVMKILKDFAAEITEQSYDNICTIKYKIRLRDSNNTIEALNKINISVYV
jgi:uncharacterized YigZ family protein